MIAGGHRPLCVGLAGLIAGAMMPQAAHAQVGAGAGPGLEEGSSKADAVPAPRKVRTRRVELAPYLEVSQNAIMSDTDFGNEVLTYTTVAAGLNAHVETRAVRINADLRYQHQFFQSGNLPDQNIFTGLANARVNLIRDVLSIEAGLLGSRLRTDEYQGANSQLATGRFTSKVYSANIGPTFKGRVADMTVAAAYRFGYNRIDLSVPNFGGLTGPAATFDGSTMHNASLSVGMQPEMLLPFGWTVSVGMTHERSNQLDQRFTDKFVRLDLNKPISPTVALVGGVGYQKVIASNRDVLRDEDGIPVRDQAGRLVTDPNSPRRLAYDNAQAIWDAGVLWRPSDRTTLEARFGQRYGSMSYTGNFSWRASRGTTIAVHLFDSVDSFGRALNNSLANLPDDFVVGRNPFSGDIAGCAFSLQSGGSCFVDTLAGISAANYRNRGIYAQLAQMSGGWTFNAVAGYSRRKFLASGGTILSAVDGVVDHVLFGNVNVTRVIDGNSTIDANVYANYFEPGFAAQGTIVNVGAFAGYHRRVGRRFTLNLSVGVDSARQSSLENVLTVLAQLGVRYQL